MDVSIFIKEPITSEEPADRTGVPSNLVLQLALSAKQAALQACAHDLDRCVKQIGCDDNLGHNVANVVQTALEGANVSVSWIPRSHDLAGSLLVLNEKWGAAFSSAPSVCPEGMSLVVNDLAVKRDDIDELFTVTPVPADEA